MSRRIHLSKADITELEEEYVVHALRSGWVAPLGPDVDAFEAEVAARVGVKHALALSSGTAALHLALLHLGARPGTSVVLPSMTFAASANAVAYTGAEPVFVDSQCVDGNVAPELLIDAVDMLLAQGREVVAAMTVDLFGRPCDYDRLEPALAQRGVPLVEDAAEALGATYRDRPAGSFGRVAALSFNGNKIMTTSGGGMLLSDDGELIAHARKLSTQSREQVPWYEHVEIGYNYRLSNILAALGRGQLARLDEMMSRRQAHREMYRSALATAPVRFLGEPERKDVEDNAWLTAIIVDAPSFSVTNFVADLQAEGVETRHLWKPMHLQPVFANANYVGTGVSDDLFARGVTLPSGSALTTTDISAVIDILQDRLNVEP